VMLTGAHVLGSPPTSDGLGANETDGRDVGRDVGREAEGDASPEELHPASMPAAMRPTAATATPVFVILMATPPVLSSRRYRTSLRA
jgi:hypothetical protein